MNTFLDKLNLISEMIQKGKIEEAFLLYQNLERAIESETSDIKAQFYYSYAIFLFQIEVFEGCMKCLIQAQFYGYPKSEILSIVKEAFIEPNLSEYRAIYEDRVSSLTGLKYLARVVQFEELPFYFIPTMSREKVYFYDQLNEEIVCFSTNLKQDMVSSSNIHNTFGDYIFMSSGDIYKIFSLLRRIPKKKCYILLEDVRLFLSFLQLPQIDAQIFLFNQVKLFECMNGIRSFLLRENVYLPRNIICNTNQEKQIELEKMILEIHEIRTQDPMRPRNNILLTIAIPSYNRGGHAYESVLHHLKSEYDDEIEILVSNNGTDNDTSELYTKISEIQDSRLKYFAFETNQGSVKNFNQVIRIASGKFVFMLSDEDTIFLDRIQDVLEEIEQNPKLSMLKCNGDGQQNIQNAGLAKKGKDAIKKYAFRANYLSGNIFSKDTLVQSGILDYVLENEMSNACISAYSHTVYELVCCVSGDVLGLDKVIFHEGEAAADELPEEVLVQHYIDLFPKYATKEGRFEQHKGFLKLFLATKVFNKDKEILQCLYYRLCLKTLFLIELAIKEYYIKRNENLHGILDAAYMICIEGYEKVFFDEDGVYGKEIKELYRCQLERFLCQDKEK